MLSYREQQANNTVRFNEYAGWQQDELRKLGYKNMGKSNVLNSTKILDEYELMNQQPANTEVHTNDTEQQWIEQQREQNKQDLEFIHTEQQRNKEACELITVRHQKHLERINNVLNKLSHIKDCIDSMVEQERHPNKVISISSHPNYKWCTDNG